MYNDINCLIKCRNVVPEKNEFSNKRKFKWHILQFLLKTHKLWLCRIFGHCLLKIRFDDKNDTHV